MQWFSTQAKFLYFPNGKTTFTNEINDYLQIFGFNRIDCIIF